MLTSPDHVQKKGSKRESAANLIPPFKDVEMKFHSDVDVHDMLALFTLGTAAKGGDQSLASMTSVYNVLAAEDPEALQILSENWYWERSYRYVRPSAVILSQI
jgi:hypothetical protein